MRGGGNCVCGTSRRQGKQTVTPIELRLQDKRDKICRTYFNSKKRNTILRLYNYVIARHRTYNGFE